MPTTPIYALRYPAASDPADVPTDMQELATDVEAALQTKASVTELAYAQITADITVPGTSTVTPVVSAGAVTYPAVPIIIEFFAPYLVINGGVGALMQMVLYADGAGLGALAQVQNNVASASLLVPVRAARRLTPTAGSHTYEVRAVAVSAAGTVAAGTGASGTFSPAFIRVSRA